MQRKVLLTGAAGFLGREVLRQLKELKQTEVLAIDNFDPLCGSSEGSQPDDIVFGDILNLPKCKPTHIIHLAALGRNLTCEHRPYQAFQVNVNGTVNLMELARHTGAEMLFCSSNIVLSPYETVYRMTKRCAEELARIYARHGTKVMILRPSNIAGPGQSRTEFQPCAFASMDRCFEQKGYIEITGDGTQRRDYIHVKDVARAFVMALDHMNPGVTLDICTGNLLSLLDLVRTLGVEKKYVEPRPGDADILISDPRPASNLMGFRSQIGIDQTIRESFPAVVSVQHGKPVHSNQ